MQFEVVISFKFLAYPGHQDGKGLGPGWGVVPAGKEVGQFMAEGQKRITGAIEGDGALTVVSFAAYKGGLIRIV